MKRSTLNSAIACCLFLLACSFKAEAKHKITFDSLSCLLIEGKITNADDGIDQICKVELISANEVVDSAILKDGKKRFKFVLEKNTYYAIRITKIGYLSKLVSVNTEMVTQSDLIYSFEFETGLIKEGAAKAFNEDILDFPVAIISFDYALDEFSYNQEYTDYIKRELRQVKSSENRNTKKIQSALTTRAIAFAE